jgi:hypothetical protein
MRPKRPWLQPGRCQRERPSLLYGHNGRENPAGQPGFPAFTFGPASATIPACSLPTHSFSSSPICSAPFSLMGSLSTSSARLMGFGLGGACAVWLRSADIFTTFVAAGY